MNAPVTVLIVDDEPPIRQFVQRVLDRAGMRTWIAADGFEAATLFATIDHVDVLVTQGSWRGQQRDGVPICTNPPLDSRAAALRRARAPAHRE